MADLKWLAENANDMPQILDPLHNAMKNMNLKINVSKTMVLCLIEYIEMFASYT